MSTPAQLRRARKKARRDEVVCEGCGKKQAFALGHHFVVVPCRFCGHLYARLAA